MNFLWRVGLLTIDIIKCDNLHDKQGAKISNNVLASIIQKNIQIFINFLLIEYWW